MAARILLTLYAIYAVFSDNYALAFVLVCVSVFIREVQRSNHD